MTHRKFIVKKVNSGHAPVNYLHSQFYWHAKSAGKIVAWSGESYVRKAHAVRMAKSFMKSGDSVSIEDDAGKFTNIGWHV